MEIAITQDSLAWTPDGVRLPAMRRCSEIFASLFAEPKGGIAAQRKALRRCPTATATEMPNLPLVLAGGSDLGLKPGSHLDFDQGHFGGYQLDKPGEHYGLCSRPANSDAHMSNLLPSEVVERQVWRQQQGD